MKRLVFGCILLVCCTHSPSATNAPAATSTAIIPTPSRSAAPAIASAPEAPPLEPGTLSNAKECGVPTDWTPMDYKYPMPVDELVVLDWKQRGDNRPLIIDEAFVLARGHEGVHTYFYLTTFYRHPKDDDKWHLSIVYDAPIDPQKWYEHAPTAVDVDEFLKGTTWFDRDDSFKRIAGQRCDAAWTRVIGSPPPPSKVF